MPVLEHTVIEGLEPIFVLLRKECLDLVFVTDHSAQLDQETLQDLDVRAVTTGEVDDGVAVRVDGQCVEVEIRFVQQDVQDRLLPVDDR